MHACVEEEGKVEEVSRGVQLQGDRRRPAKCQTRGRAQGYGRPLTGAFTRTSVLSHVVSHDAPTQAQVLRKVLSV